MSKEKNSRPLQESEYVALAEFRYQLRKFLRHMEEEVRQFGINPQQYQLLLAIKGLPKSQVPTITCLAERMQLNHNSMVELVDRCEERNMLRRQRSSSDRRQVTLALTSEGEGLLRKLGSAARQELRSIGPMLVESVLRLTDDKTVSAADNKLRKAVIKKAGS
ncbi:MAG TPA: MarR family winged helix-turn-helix transcriptional regulator [Candidatus Angelobacter sp.]|jgi:DNA-binding MarR family transcriptional regulator|nr:MarR family winged helix-turn-helix transcriptional regulator [Candidatus Angelobacter sp.]HKT50267.1 MarR family winged helix-turn-helix transcriptional regulator [Candidatus Angelobacter sp.]